MKDHPFTDADVGDEFNIDGEDYLLIQSGFERYTILISGFSVPILSNVTLSTAREWLAEKAGMAMTDGDIKKLCGQITARYGIYAFVAVSMEMQYGLGIAVANSQGYYPLPAAVFSAETFDKADRLAAEYNLSHLDLDSDEAFRIVASTMGGKAYHTQG